VSEQTARRWLGRCNERGRDGLCDAARSGRPPTYTPEEVGAVVAASLTRPDDLGSPCGCWTLDRLVASLNEERSIAI
jgi:transposase